MTSLFCKYKVLLVCFLLAFVTAQVLLSPARSAWAMDDKKIEEVIQERLSTIERGDDSQDPAPEASQPLPSQTSEAQSALSTYRVGADDEIKITVFGEDDLTGTFAVSGNGYISMPLIGEVLVRDLTLQEVEQSIVAKLKDGYVLDPRVSIEVTKYRPFYILGEVRAPGSYGYVNNMSVLNAVVLAGGFTYRANKKNVQIMRTRENHSEVSKNLPVETVVLPGDIILIEERFF